MRKVYFKSIAIILATPLFLTNCGGSSDTTTTEKKSDKDTLTVKNKSEEVKEKPIVSLTEKEAEAKMKTFLKENSRKYREYGEFQDMDLVGGNYNADGAFDYFYKVNFYPGGDFVYPTHFFYDSEQDKIRELTLNKSSKYLQSVDAKEVKEGKIIGSANVWSARSMDLEAYRDVKAEFTIDGSKINCDKKFIPKLKKAEKEIDAELDRMEQEMMENADGVNSSEEADY
jgi:hypothetical protein